MEGEKTLNSGLFPILSMATSYLSILHIRPKRSFQTKAFSIKEKKKCKLSTLFSATFIKKKKKLVPSREVTNKSNDSRLPWSCSYLSAVIDITAGLLWIYTGLPWSFCGKESTCQCRSCRRHRFNSRVGKIP